MKRIMSNNVIGRYFFGLFPLCFILVSLFVISFFVALCTYGLPKWLIREIEVRLDEQGTYVRFESLKLELLYGVGCIAEGVKYYEDKPRENSIPLATLDKLRVNISVGDLWEGHTLSFDDLNVIEFEGVEVSVPLTIDDSATANRFTVHHGKGIFTKVSDQIFSLNDCSFDSEDMQFEVNINLVGFPLKSTSYNGPMVYSELPSWKTDLSHFLHEFHKISFSPRSQPKVSLSGDVDVNDTLHSELSLKIESELCQYHGYEFKNVLMLLNYQSGMVGLEKVSFEDDYGQFLAEGMYNIDTGELWGGLKSGILWDPLRRALIDNSPLPYGIRLPHPVEVKSKFEVSLDPATFAVQNYKAIGSFYSSAFAVAGVNVSSIKGEFSLKPDSYYVQNFEMKVKESSLSGRALYKDHQIQISGKSSIPLEDYLTMMRELGRNVVLPADLTISGQPVVDFDTKIILPKPEEFEVKSPKQTLVSENKEQKEKSERNSTESKDTLNNRNETPEIYARLSVVCNDVEYREVKFKHVDFDAWYENGNGKITHLLLEKADGRKLEASGKFEDFVLSFKGESSILLNDYYALSHDINVKIQSDQFAYKDDSSLELTFDGFINLKTWEDHIVGKAETKNILYNNVPVTLASANYIYGGHKLIIKDIKLVNPYDTYDLLDKTKYSPRPSSGTCYADSVVYNFETNVVSLNHVHGTIYPEPVVTMFAPHLKWIMSQFRFYKMPTISLSGTLDAMDWEMPHTEMRISIDCAKDGRLDYDFLGRTLEMTNARTVLHLRKKMLYLNNFKGKIWEGNFDGRLGISVSESPYYDGSMKFTGCNLKSVGKTYGSSFDNARVNSNIDFSMKGNEIKNLRANGAATLTEGNLLHIPFFGPLSTVFNMVFGFVPGAGDLVGSTIDQAHCNYNIVDGNLFTNDFEAKGSNMKISGRASVDIAKLWLNMDIKVDLKGLIGFITKPLMIPLGGIFQFHGEGELAKPEWSLTPFSGEHGQKEKKTFGIF